VRPTLIMRLTKRCIDQPVCGNSHINYCQFDGTSTEDTCFTATSRSWLINACSLGARGVLCAFRGESNVAMLRGLRGFPKRLLALWEMHAAAVVKD